MSGTGVVADGVLFPDGAIAVRWRGPHPSTVAWARFDDAYHVHGHGGATRFVWLDPAIEIEVCGAAGRAPNGDRLDCNQPAGHELPHCDGSRDNLCWRGDEPAWL